MSLKLAQYIQNEIKPYTRNVVHLDNFDFKYGTYIIKKPGLYILDEDIVFDPNPKHDWFPTKRQLQEEYSHSAFFLGFFAAITIESSHVVINLNGHCIRQSKMHALQQRFFQTIQLNNSPFIIKQGPSGTFADSGIYESKFIWIKNGSLGLTSHYCVHGNNNSYVLIENVQMHDFETGAIAANRIDHLVVRGCKLLGTRMDTPVTAMYSVLRNILIIFRKSGITELMDYKFRNRSGYEIFKQLNILHDTVLENYKKSGYKHVLSREDDYFNKEIRKYIYNDTGLNDGSSIVGIQITPKGVAINAFDETVCPSANGVCVDGHHSKHIFIENLEIRRIHANPAEIVSCKSGKNNVVGAMGELPDVYQLVKRNNHYRSTTINDAQLWLGKVYNNHDKKTLPISTIAIPPHMIEWAENGTDFSDIVKQNDVSLRYGLDIMGHVNKGVMGLRIGGCHYIQLENIEIDGIYNRGKKSSVDNRPSYTGKYEKSDSNLDEETGVWYSGNLAFGVVFSSVKKVKIHGVGMGKCTSETGKYYEYFYNQTPQIQVNYN